MSRETWYVMEDGSCGDPRDIVSDEKGNLSHTDGRKVSYSPHGPRSRGVDADLERAKAVKSGAKTPNEARAESDPPPVETADVKPEQGKRRYKTRESKAE